MTFVILLTWVQRLYPYLTRIEQWLKGGIEKPFSVPGWLELQRRLLAAADRVPVTRIVQEAPFMDLNLTIPSGVFIPRPETEQLADLVIKTLKPLASGTVVDACSGSGALALAIQKHCPQLQVYAIEKNPVAVATIAQNARRYHLPVRILQADCLHLRWRPDELTILVANPPYVAWDEMHDVGKEVMEYDPTDAWLVPSQDPLIFYRRLLEWAAPFQPIVFFETSPSLALAVHRLCETHQFKAHIFKDWYGQARFVVALPESHYSAFRRLMR